MSTEQNILKPKLLVVTTTFPRWENDTDPPFVYELSTRLTDNFDVTVHTPHYPGAKRRDVVGNILVYRFRYFFERFEKIAGQTAILPFLRQNKGYFAVLPFFLFCQFLSLLVLIRKIKPEIIHAHWLIPVGFFSVCCSVLGKNIPVIITCHGADVFGLKMAFFRALKKWTLLRAHCITVVSNALKDEIIKIAGSTIKPQIIPMGVDSMSFNPSRKSLNLSSKLKIDGVFLLFVGRLTEKKGVKYLLEALKIVRDQKYKATLVIIGDGEQKDLLQYQAVHLGVADHIRFQGGLSNSELPAYYATADIFIGPSITTPGGDSEGFGVTFVEASMSGCLLIGAATGGIVDIIDDGISGMLTAPGNSHDLANRLVWAIEHPRETEKYKMISRKLSLACFDWKVIAKRYIDLLATCLS